MSIMWSLQHPQDYILYISLLIFHFNAQLLGKEETSYLIVRINY